MRNDHFQEKTTAYLKEQMKSSPELRRMYLRDPLLESDIPNRSIDLLNEKKLTTKKGLVCKYPGRALMLLNYTCAANCRYCERQDRVGAGLDKDGWMSKSDIRNAVNYLSNRPDITEIIFSGGDPLTNPNGLLLASELLSELSHIEILRIHTRFPMQRPLSMKYDVLEKLSNLRPTFYFSLHINHFAELTSDTMYVIDRLKDLNFILLSQSIFLRNINDSVNVLVKLFNKLIVLGVRPYYIYHCQELPTTKHFVVSLENEIKIMTALRERISGLAYPMHVIDMQFTTGKIIVPTEHWKVELSSVTDFLGKKHNFSNQNNSFEKKII